MTVRENTVCSLIQTFPVLLILAQKQNKCLETPFVYKPPSPTHSPEYYEALDTLFHSVYSQNNGGHGGQDYGHTLCYSSSKKKPCYQPNSGTVYYTPSYSYIPTYGTSLSPGTGHYGTSHYGTGSGYVYPNFLKGNLYTVNGNLSYGYASAQKYNVNNKYKVVVKKTKVGNRKRKSGKNRGMLTNIADSISHDFRPKRDVEDEVPSCSTVNNMPARCVDLETQCPILYEVVNTNKNNPMFVTTLKQLQCGHTDDKSPRICCPLEWIPKAPPARTKPPRRQTPTITKPPVTESSLPEETCKSINSGYLPGRCVSLLECPSLYKKATERSQDPAVRNEMFRIHCGWVDNNFKQAKVCCPIESIGTPASTQPSNELPQGDAPSQNSEDFVDTLPSPPVCGPYKQKQGVTRVVGGSRAPPKMFPWMALLGYRRRWEIEWRCGGSLISTRHVLTAGHCIYGNTKSLFQVRLGELDLSRDDEDATPIDIPIKKWIIHEPFDPEINENDIGMLILATEVKYTDYIKPICMPMRPDLRSNNFEDYRPFLAGWGQIKFGGKKATRLQFIQIPVTNTAECNEIYKKDDENFKILDNRSLCAGYKQGKKDSCSGDSGGPLIQPERDPKTKNTTFYQTGIISSGKGCGAAGYPGIYVRVTEYIPWIVKHTTGKIVS